MSWYFGHQADLLIIEKLSFKQEHYIPVYVPIHVDVPVDLLEI